MTTLNWRLIFLLSLFGLAMAFATVWAIPSKFEPLFWLAIFAVCADRISRRAPGKLVLHGLLVGRLPATSDATSGALARSSSRRPMTAPAGRG
jgi:hypothetical protein